MEHNSYRKRGIHPNQLNNFKRYNRGDVIEILRDGFGLNAQFSYDRNTGELFFDGSDTIQGTYHIATLENLPNGFDINQHLIFI